MLLDHMFRILLPLLLLVTGAQHVSGIDIYTPSEVEAVNGTNVKLKCTFTSSHPVTPQSVIVSWNFRPINSGADESVFYYQEVPYPPQHGRFKGHAVWSGDIMRRDASITLHEVPPTFNGTYICQVRNRPDVHGSNGEIMLKVVNKVSLSEISMLALIVGIACGVILVLLGIVVAVKFCRKRHMGNDIELHPGEQEWKDTSVCTPAEEAHLTLVTVKKKADSSDDEESEPSSGDDDDEEDDGEEDDDDDDDDDDDGGGSDE